MRERCLPLPLLSPSVNPAAVLVLQISFFFGVPSSFPLVFFMRRKTCDKSIEMVLRYVVKSGLLLLCCTG